MSRTTTSRMTLAAVVAGLHLLLAAASASSTSSSAAAAATSKAPSIWAVSIDNGPAPPVESEPPVSRGAVRNKAYLKYQIPGIVGGYVVFVLIFFVFYFCVGKRLRKHAQAAPGGLAREMVKPMKKIVDPSPISPSTSYRSWTRFGRSPSMKSTRTMDIQKSPTGASVVSFDTAVIEQDKARREAEMEQLYAVVMSQDTKAPKSIVQVQEEELGFAIPQSPSHVRTGSVSSRSFSQRRPPQLQQDDSRTYAEPPTPRSTTRVIQQQPQSPGYYEPDTPMSATYPTTPRSLYNVQPIVPFSPLQSSSNSQGHDSPPQPRPVSRDTTHSRKTSNASSKSKTTRSVRNLRISAPMPHNAYLQQQQLQQQQHQADLASAPLSPRNYDPPAPPPPPPSPPLRSPTPIEDHSDDDDDDLAGEVIIDTHRFHQYDPNRPTSPEDIIHAYGYDGLESPRPVPQPAPHRSVAALRGHTQPQTYQASRSQPISHSSATSTSSLPFRQQQQQHQHGSASTNTSSSTLPLRAYTSIAPPPLPAPPLSPLVHHNPTANLPLRSISGSLSKNPYYSPSPYSPAGATPTKQTFLSPRRDRFAPRPANAHAALNSAGLLSAGLNSAGFSAMSPMRTAGMAAPYSPYFQHALVTPVTPRLMTRKDRKAMDKEDGGKLRAIGEERDAEGVVRGERELWGDAYGEDD